MELLKILLDTSALSKWIATDLKPCAPTKFEKITHVLSTENFNRIIRDKSSVYQFLGLSIDSIFVYDKGNHQYCTYLILGLKQADLDLFIKELGMPKNVSVSDLFDGDFDFLNWKHKDFEIFLTRTYSEVYGRNGCKVSIMNMKLKDTIDDREIK